MLLGGATQAVTRYEMNCTVAQEEILHTDFRGRLGPSKSTLDMAPNPTGFGFLPVE